MPPSPSPAVRSPSTCHPDRHFGIFYNYKGAARASLLSDNATVPSGQANMNTNPITGVLDKEPSFSAALRAGRGHLPLHLQFTAGISFRLFYVFPSVGQDMYVNCDLLVGANGSLLRESVGAPCDCYV